MTSADVFRATSAIAGANGSSKLLPGFTNGVLDSQAVFRVALDAMSRPGTILKAPITVPSPPGLTPAAACLALTLLDTDTAVWLSPTQSTADIVSYLSFHAGPPLVENPGEADFLFVGAGDQIPSLDLLKIGEPEYPDNSATLVVTLPALHDGTTRVLKGPGIQSSTKFSPCGLDETFWMEWDRNQMLFPQGVDVFFVTDAEISALPRTTEQVVECT